MNTVDDFVTLFRGRGDCYGAWEGGCIRQPLTRPVFEQHLADGPHIGVYPGVVNKGDTLCVWGCSDIDYDGYDHALALHDTLAAVGIPSWCERTVKGWHVWVFATQLVPAVDMRNMFLAAHQVCEVPPKEVNPKQTDLSNGSVGNYVRLPYHGWNQWEGAGVSTLTNPRRVVDTAVGRHVFLTLEDFLRRALASRVTPDQIAEVASYYTPPQAPEFEALPELGDVGVAASMLTPLGKVIYRDGPIEGRDRSTTLTHLAHECHKAGLAPGDALKVLEAADWKWGKKYVLRRDGGVQELTKLVVRAYGSP